MVLNLIIAAVSLLVGGGVVLFVTKRMAHTRAKNIIEEAKLEADVLKKNKLLEVKEAELKMKADVEKQANSRMQKIQAAEAKSKQRELQLNQQQSELQRKRNENENMKAVLDQQVAAVEMREQEVEKMQKSVQETLEHISGLSAEEAKEKLVESLKDEAKTAAASYINDIMDDAKLTANKEVHSPADMKGIKIRTMVDPIQTACWEALGASVTPVPYAELYTALQQGMVDAQENPPSNIVSSKLYELQKYCMKTNHNFTTTIMAASPVFWSRISDADKELIAQTWKDTEMYVRSLTSDLSDGFFKTMAENGTTVVDLTPDELKEFQDVAKSVWPKIEESMGSEAYNKLINFVMDYQANK
mgnify:CR=1 FL=1